jgi:hypothetical protein
LDISSSKTQYVNGMANVNSCEMTIDYNPVREKLMIKKVGVVDKPEAIIRYKKIQHLLTY